MRAASLGSLLNQSQTYQGNPCGVYPDLSSFTGSGIIQNSVTCIKRFVPSKDHISSEEHQWRFEEIKDWSFLKERRVQLAEGKYIEFQTEIAKRHWTQLAEPMPKYDPAIVMEFYANACPTEEGVTDKCSKVRGQWIPYNTDATNQFLGNPLILEEGQQCEYTARRGQTIGFDEEAIDQLLCFPEHDFVWSMARKWLRIMQTKMTTLTQIWMTFLLNNILLSDHNSNLTLPKCQLVYNIMEHITVHVAQLIQMLSISLLVLNLLGTQRTQKSPTRHCDFLP